MDALDAARRDLATAHERIQLARQALVADGYFTDDQVGEDIAPRIIERLAAAGPGGRTWSDRLRAPFPDSDVMYKPTLWCALCRKADSRVCASHRKIRCEHCKQNVTEAHNDLAFIGHADTTNRLNQVDPNWTWEPAYRAVDHDLLAAAIATGNADIVNAVIANAPPLLDAFNGMWMLLTVHDDEGRPVTRLCYGDAETKTGPNAVKERIGDGIRNGAQRFGVAWYLWSKADHSQAEAEARLTETPGKKPRATKAQAEKSSAVDKTRPQELADLAAKIVSEGSSKEVLFEVVYEVARKEKLLNAEVTDPWDRKSRRQLTAVITLAREAIEHRTRKEQEGDAGSG